jgi:transcriptional regulator with XRE-family HTH domain
MTELARRVGISTAYLSLLESGKNKQPSRDILAALSRELQVDPIFWLDDNVESPFTIFEAVKEEIPEDIQQFLLSQKALPWVRLAQELDQLSITPEQVKVFADAIRAAQTVNQTVKTKETTSKE